MRSAVAEVYRRQPIYNVTTIENAMSGELVSWRQYLMLLGAFAGIAALLACYLPARRALTIDPIVALRTE